MTDINQLFQQFIWESEYAQRLRPETIKSYKDVFSLLTKVIPDLTIDDITPATVTNFFRILNERKRIVGRNTIKVGIKKSTVATYWGKLNSFFTWLEQRNHILANPFGQMRFPKVSYEDVQYLKKEEVERIFTALHTHYNGNLLILKRNLAMFNVLLFCGLRREELLLLQVRDIDFERKTLVVRGENSKSALSRTLPLTKAVIGSLKDYLRQRKPYSCEYLFVSSSDDRRLTFEGLKYTVRRIGQKAKVPFHVHQFRHTFAVNFLRQSGNIFVLKELMGHRDITMTALYLRGLPVDSMRQDIEKMSIDGLL